MVTPAVEFGMRHNFASGIVLRSFLALGADIRTNDTWTVRSRFASAPAAAGWFTTTSQQDRAAARVGAGQQLYRSGGFDVRAQYVGRFGAHATSHSGMLSLAWQL